MVRFSARTEYKKVLFENSNGEQYWYSPEADPYSYGEKVIEIVIVKKNPKSFLARFKENWAFYKFEMSRKNYVS